jgi:hypothetical protein
MCTLFALKVKSSDAARENQCVPVTDRMEKDKSEEKKAKHVTESTGESHVSKIVI